ncbi:MAG: hypothetical protein ABSF53_24275 [Terracidiphilus sp.]
MLFPRSIAAGISSRAARISAHAFAVFILALPLAGQTGAPLLPLPPATVSTIPANGDVNPYGTAYVPFGVSDSKVPHSVLRQGDLLVANFNNKENLAGLGTTIVRINGNGQQSLFFQSSSAYAGLTGALRVLSDGTVIVGNLPTSDGTSATAQVGALQIISPAGFLLSAVTNTAIAGPWGLAVNEQGSTVYVFVANVLNGTISRLTFKRPHPNVLTLENATVITTGLTHRGDPAALELGPSGLLYNPANDTLYFASSTDNAIYYLEKVSKVGADEATPKLFVQDLTHLHGPIDLTFAPNGHLLVANSDGSNVNAEEPSEIVEYNGDGAFVGQFSVDANPGGAFGIAREQFDPITIIAAVDDNASTVTQYTKFDQ